MMDKCEHGVYIAQGDVIAWYCTLCNPAAARIIAPTRRHHVAQVPEKDIDAVDYMALPVAERLASVAAYFEGGNNG